LEQPEIRFVYAQDGGASHKRGEPVYQRLDDELDNKSWRDSYEAEIPDQYFVFHSINESQYRTKGRTEDGPFELLLVTPEGSSLVAVQYQARYMGPSSIPTLGINGWKVGGSSSISMNKIQENEKAFI